MKRSRFSRWWLLALALSTLMPGRSHGLAIPEMATLERVGAARMQVLFWNIYDAVLFAPQGTWSDEGPYALALTYLRDLNGQAIAERSIEEIRRQGRTDEQTLRRWQKLLTEIIPDVRERDEITGFADEQAHTRFYLDGRLIGTVEEPEFTRAFFGIWLDETTSEPSLRARLLGDQR